MLAYEDGDGAIRLWDAPSAREVGRLEDGYGIALDVLAVVPGFVCRTGPVVDTATPGSGSGSGSEEPMPPEEGPVTSP